MKVYVESNFVLEIALGQEEASLVERILSMAETGDIELAIPAFALNEPFYTISGRAKERKQLAQLLSNQLQQLSRSSPSKGKAEQFSHAPDALNEIAGLERDGLRSTVNRILAVSKVIALDADAFRDAQRYEQTYHFELPDAIIYASIVSDLKAGDVNMVKCFISRNWKHFRDPGIEKELHLLGCTYIEHFANALNFISSSGIH